MEKTILGMIELAKSNHPDRTYLADKSDSGWVRKTFSETLDESDILASGLIELGFRPEQNAAILAEASSLWIIFELGILLAGGASVPLSIKLLPEEIPFRVNHSESKFIAVSKLTLEKVLQVFSQFNETQIKLIFLDNDHNFALNIFKKFSIDPEKYLILFNDLMEKGKQSLEKNRAVLKKRGENIKENTTATISYTSGTTGNPKGIMLTHLNYWANCEDSLNMFEVPDTFKTLVILPCDHSFAHTVGIYAGLMRGIQLYFVDYRGGALSALKNIPQNILDSRPDFLLTVPALSGNFMNKIISGVETKGKLISSLFHLGLKCGYEFHGNGYNKPFFLKRFFLWFPYKFVDALVFKKVRSIFGSDIKFCVGGGALLDIKQQQFFYTIGVPIYQGYGLTEAAPVISSNTPKRHKLGSSGIIGPSITCKIIKDNGEEAEIGEKGQIVIRGNNVMKGYFKNPEETAKTVKNNWLYTGDLGYYDKDDFLVVVGREKALLISEDGEKYSPEEIEEAIVNCAKYIPQVMIYNDHKKYTTALITLDTENLKKVIREKKINSKEKLLEFINTVFNQYLSDPSFKNKFPRKWCPSTFMIIPEQFSEKNHMINSTMKMVRYKISEAYEDKINFMYTSEGNNYINSVNLNVLESLFF